MPGAGGPAEAGNVWPTCHALPWQRADSGPRWAGGRLLVMTGDDGTQISFKPETQHPGFPSPYTGLRSGRRSLDLARNDALLAGHGADGRVAPDDDHSQRRSASRLPFARGVGLDSPPELMSTPSNFESVFHHEVPCYATSAPRFDRRVVSDPRCRDRATAGHGGGAISGKDRPVRSRPAWLHAVSHSGHRRHGQGERAGLVRVRKTWSDWAAIDILLRRSTDDGKTWSEPQRLADVPGPITKNPFALAVKGVKAEDITYNNPVLIADRDGTVHGLFCVEYMSHVLHPQQ